MNYTTVYGLRMIKGNGQLHQGVEGFYHEKQPVHVSLLSMSGIQSVLSGEKRVYIFENSGVFSGVISRLQKDRGLVCTNGQLHLASLILLDLLAKQGYQMYYAGDFEPEGLNIAWRLKQRYQEQLVLWRYDVADYEVAISNKSVSAQRIKKMDKIHDEVLEPVKCRIAESKKAGYQEMLIDRYLEELNESEYLNSHVF